MAALLCRDPLLQQEALFLYTSSGSGGKSAPCGQLNPCCSQALEGINGYFLREGEVNRSDDRAFLPAAGPITDPSGRFFCSQF